MGAPKFTRWFPETVKPDRNGVYQRDDKHGGYQHWNGRWWGRYCDTPAKAFASRARKSLFQGDPWRGLASKP